jgi:hypothetical protein
MKDIKKHVELIHKIIGKDCEAPNGGIASIVNVYEEHVDWLNRDFVVVEYKKFNDSPVTDEVYILKSIFDLTEQEIVENQVKLKQELELVNQLKNKMLCEMFDELKDSLDNNRFDLDNNDFTVEQNTGDSCVRVRIYGVRKNINLLCTVSRTNKYFWAQLRFYKLEGWEVKRVSVPGRTMQELIDNIDDEINEFEHEDISKLHSMII